MLKKEKKTNKKPRNSAESEREIHSETPNSRKPFRRKKGRSILKPNATAKQTTGLSELALLVENTTYSNIQRKQCGTKSRIGLVLSGPSHRRWVGKGGRSSFSRKRSRRTVPPGSNHLAVFGPNHEWPWEHVPPG